MLVSLQGLPTAESPLHMPSRHQLETQFQFTVHLKPDEWVPAHRCRLRSQIAPYERQSSSLEQDREFCVAVGGDYLGMTVADAVIARREDKSVAAEIYITIAFLMRLA